MSASTPMMQQYDRLKSQNRDAILFFRLGDFYEMFKTDAKEASTILGIALTARHGIPMCGIPHHAVLSYVPRLLSAGKKVAICEQTYVPEKGIAERVVVEILTPGTVIDELYLGTGEHNFIASICGFRGGRESFCISFLDVSTGELILGVGEEVSLQGNFHLYRPKEVLIQESLLTSSLKEMFSQYSTTVNSLPDWNYTHSKSWENLCRIMKVTNLKAYGLDKDSHYVDSLGPLLEYVEMNTGKEIRHINSLRVIRVQEYLVIDSSSQKNLEILHVPAEDGREASLFAAIDQTRSGMGKRLLKQWLLYPLIHREKITTRQKHVSIFYHDQLLLSGCREILAVLLDLPRLCMRVSMEKANPRDIVAIQRTVSGYLRVYELLGNNELVDTFATEDIPVLRNTAEHLSRAVTDNPPIVLTEGGIINEGFCTDVDHLRHLVQNSQNLIDEYVKSEGENSGIQNLRVKFNGIVGYFLEVSKGQSQKVPSHFQKRQELVNVERFTTVRLKELAAEISSAQDSLIDLERRMFITLRKELQELLPALFKAAQTLATLDCLQSLAYQATLHGYTCPEFTDGRHIEITGGRHPVVETFLDSGAFVANNLALSDERFFTFVTGPNMAGKSTYLRQNALIVLLAHIGSFVPADSATMGIVDQIFCRVGASDNLAQGESTFLVEMNETAHILRNASNQSLIIMDEVGRGTSTRDGLAIAWAISEYILQHLQCKTLFATHFHELSQLQHENLRNLSLQVKEDDGDIIFLNKVIEEPSNNSYGLYVAKIAGIPDEIIFRAGELLESIQKTDLTKNFGDVKVLPRVQQSLFAQDDVVLQELRGINLNSLTPIDAFNCLQRMQRMLDD